MGQLERVNGQLAAFRSGAPRGEQRSSIDQWISEYLLPWGGGQFAYGGNSYPFTGLNSSYGTSRAYEFTSDLPGHTAAVSVCPPVFAAEMVRALVLSQARFTFRNARWTATPRRVFGTSALGMLERPWRNGTTGDLIARMEWHAGLAGNAFATNWQQGGTLRILRPDWTAIVYGSQQEPDDPAGALDAEIIGYVYQNGGLWGNQGKSRMVTLPPGSVAHWAPLPDPLNAGLGMSWVTPAVRDIQGDVLATQHKIKFFENGATANLVVKGLPAATPEQFRDLVEVLEAEHRGVANAYKTLYLSAGADATVVGSDLRQMDFHTTQGAGENADFGAVTGAGAAAGHQRGPGRVKPECREFLGVAAHVR